jgi:transposase
MSIVTVGIGLAKNVFAIHGVDATGKVVLVKPKVTRDQLVALIAQLPPCLIGMEACSVHITGPVCSSDMATP